MLKTFFSFVKNAHHPTQLVVSSKPEQSYLFTRACLCPSLPHRIDSHPLPQNQYINALPSLVRF
jgi:hypothetical protein